MRFRACLGREACREDDTGCHTCGRSHEEIAGLRALTSNIALFVERLDYDNYEDFLDYVVRKTTAKIRSARVTH